MEISAPEFTDHNTARQASPDRSGEKPGLPDLFSRFLKSASEHFKWTAVNTRLTPVTVGADNVEKAAQPERPERFERPERPESPEQPVAAGRDDPAPDDLDDLQNGNGNEMAAVGEDRHPEAPPANERGEAGESRAEKGAEMVEEKSSGGAAQTVVPEIASGMPQFPGQLGELLRDTNGVAVKAATNADAAANNAAQTAVNAVSNVAAQTAVNAVSNVAARTADSANAALNALQQVAMKADASANNTAKGLNPVDSNASAAAQSNRPDGEIRVTVTRVADPVISKPMNTLSPGGVLGEAMVDGETLPSHGRPQTANTLNPDAKSQVTNALNTGAKPQIMNAGDLAGRAGAGGENAAANGFGTAMKAAATNHTQGASGDTQQAQTVAQVGGPESRSAANAQAATQARRPAANAMPPHEQVAVQIKKAIGDGVDRISIQLKPGNLGRVDVKLEMTHDGRVTAVVSADKPETLEALQRDARGLERALQDAGLKADSESLSFNLRGENHGQTADEPPVQATDLAKEEVAETSPPDTAVAALMGADDGRIDIRI